MKKILIGLFVVSLTACSTVPMNTPIKSGVEEVTPCTNGFDSVDVCQLSS